MCCLLVTLFASDRNSFNNFSLSLSGHYWTIGKCLVSPKLRRAESIPRVTSAMKNDPTGTAAPKCDSCNLLSWLLCAQTPPWLVITAVGVCVQVCVLAQGTIRPLYQHSPVITTTP